MEIPRRHEHFLTTDDIEKNTVCSGDQKEELESLHDAETLERNRKLGRIRMQSAHPTASPRANCGRRKARSAPVSHRLSNPVKTQMRNGNFLKHQGKIGNEKKRVNRKQKKINKNCIKSNVGRSIPSEGKQTDIVYISSEKQLASSEQPVSDICESDVNSTNILNKFSGLRDSVSSEKQDVERDDVETAPSSRLSRINDNLSLFSPEMPDFPDSLLNWIDSETGLGESVDSKAFLGLRSPVVQFAESPAKSDLSEHRLSSSNQSVQLDRTHVYSGDLERHAGESEGHKKAYTKESRSRFVNRFHNVISPDLKLRLMTGDKSVSAV